MLALTFLAGQSLIALVSRLPIDDRLWLLLLPILPFLRNWTWLSFVAGCLWQWSWQFESISLCHNFFWFLCSAETAQDPIPLVLMHTPLDLWAGSLARRAQDVFLNWDPRWGPWILQFGFGMKDQGAEDWPGIYEELGLLHVLVVSGSHFSFIGWLGQKVIEGPGRLAYMLRLLPPPLWLGWTTLARIALSGLITVFALAVGFNPPCQRSWLALLLQLWLPLLGAPLDPARQDRWVFSCQALCFPNSFLSLSNALSWSAYSLVRYLKPWPRFWQRRLLPAVEGPLIAVNLSYFGTFSPSGIILNTLLQPVWHLVLGSGLLFLISPHPWIGQGLRVLLEGIHELILAARRHGQASGPLFWGFPGIVRGLLWIGASWTFFALWRRREDACGMGPSPVT